MVVHAGFVCIASETNKLTEWKLHCGPRISNHSSLPIIKIIVIICARKAIGQISLWCVSDIIWRVYVGFFHFLYLSYPETHVCCPNTGMLLVKFVIYKYICNLYAETRTTPFYLSILWKVGVFLWMAWWRSASVRDRERAAQQPTSQKYDIEFYIHCQRHIEQLSAQYHSEKIYICILLGCVNSGRRLIIINKIIFHSSNNFAKLKQSPIIIISLCAHEYILYMCACVCGADKRYRFCDQRLELIFVWDMSVYMSIEQYIYIADITYGQPSYVACAYIIIYIYNMCSPTSLCSSLSLCMYIIVIIMYFMACKRYAKDGLCAKIIKNERREDAAKVGMCIDSNMPVDLFFFVWFL